MFNSATQQEAQLGADLAKINKQLGEQSEAAKAYADQCWDRFERGEITAEQRDAYIMDAESELELALDQGFSFDRLYEQAARL